MKKTILGITIPIIVVICSTCGLLITKNTTMKNVKTIYGTELATLINKAVNENENNKISKDEKGYYQENASNSIKIYVKMNTNGKTYQMETFYNNDITNFVENFNLVRFKCTKIEYHKDLGRVSKLYFEEILE